MSRRTNDAPRIARAIRWALVTAAAASLIASCGDSNEPLGYAGIVREPVPVVEDVELPGEADSGGPFPLRAQRDLLPVYFGYTSCPDVCPTTMSDLRRALGSLPSDDATRIDVAMVTVDPERDTPDLLTGYVRAFIPRGHALRTEDPALLRRTADLFGADYSVTTTSEGITEVAHTGFIYAVDSAGQLRVQWSFGTTSESIAHDLSCCSTSWRQTHPRMRGHAPAPTARPTAPPTW